MFSNFTLLYAFLYFSCKYFNCAFYFRLNSRENNSSALSRSTSLILFEFMMSSIVNVSLSISRLLSIYCNLRLSIVYFINYII